MTQKQKDTKLEKWRKIDQKMDPFTNQPYAFDDHGSSVDPREVEFNNGIREITVGLPKFLHFWWLCDVCKSQICRKVLKSGPLTKSLEKFVMTLVQRTSKFAWKPV